MSELRYNNATGDWVIIETARGLRPEEYHRECAPPELPERVDSCPFCPGNEEKTPPEIMVVTNGSPDRKPNGPGWQIRLIPNKYPTLTPVLGEGTTEMREFFREMEGYGFHEVVVDTPLHNQPVTSMSDRQVCGLFKLYRDRFKQLESDYKIKYVAIFKNHGNRSGASLTHPHSQVIASPFLPPRVSQKLGVAWDHFYRHDECVFCALIARERKAKVRVVYETKRFMVIHPYASSVGFETWVLPLRHKAHFSEATDGETEELGLVIRDVLTRLNRADNEPDYNYMIHSTPILKGTDRCYHWYVQIMPRTVQFSCLELWSGVFISLEMPEVTAEMFRNFGPAPKVP